MSNVVKWFSSDMQGAPQVTNDWGVLIGMLDACLINGFNTQNPSSVTRSGSTVTMTFSGGGHGFLQHQVVLVSGAAQPEYNGEQRVTAVTGTTVTFTIAGTPTSPATGTIAVKTAALGFEKPFSGTNKAVYRSSNLSSTRMFLRVDNSLAAGWDAAYAKFGKVTIADAMSDVDTFTGSQAPFFAALPDANHALTGSGSTAYNGWAKWYYARVTSGSDANEPTAGSRKWVLIGDDKGFYLSIAWQPTPILDRATYAFGDFVSLNSGEAYNCLLQSRLAYWPANNTSDSQTKSRESLFSSDAVGGTVIMKPASGVGGMFYARGLSLGVGSGEISGLNSSPQIPAPNPSDSANLFATTYLAETSQSNEYSTAVTSIRGRLRGAFWCLMQRPYSDCEIVSIEGEQYMGLSYSYAGVGSYGMVLFKITGAWT